MQLPIPLFIGLRYSQSRKGHAFLSFITLFSVTGIFLGVMALTLVSSVMNGFEGELKKRILGVLPHLVVSTDKTKPESWPELLKAQDERVLQVSPFAQSEALIQSSKQLSGALLQGVSVDALPQFLKDSLQIGDWQEFGQSRYQVMLGAALADKLRVQVGQKVRLLLPSGGSYTPMGWMPRQRVFTVAGIFNSGSEVDKVVAVVLLGDLQKLAPKPELEWRISLSDAFSSVAIAPKLAALPGVSQVVDWRVSHGKLFSAVAMEKAMMWLMLLLIVAVAAFNIVSALVMMVTDKQREVAILKTQGMTNSQLFLVFAVQGMSHGVVGAFAGALVGVMLCWQLNPLMALLGLQLLPGMALPIDLQPLQLLFIVLSALALTALAVIYPAWRAVQIEPAEILRDE
ncbi:MAG TPA: lipoprotein-releasing ABC transporter permease subunit [Rheinheimera sp.]|uniref:lipoprotein-releasing ABC transporter permease subunit n=1 Tax=Rheinheimera sp. TaxID=1869214 RepID=UPI000ED14DE8|nr:lipoprotein-releasing ABC transporter permease subunit [Rheinheimera sp.]HCU66870.1 lipoprotein-releasing ABC transporter permease subunit [Rheinheimera sp.]